MEQLRYPIGRFQPPKALDLSTIAFQIDEIAALPKQIRTATAKMSEEQLDTPYRSEGWTIRQVVHHIPDSHLNSYIRFKWTLTEENPTIKAYEEHLWAELEDGKFAPIESSLLLLEALHARWVRMLRNLSKSDWQRTLVHPQSGATIPLYEMVALYAWHGKHHLGHIELVQ